MFRIPKRDEVWLDMSYPSLGSYQTVRVMTVVERYVVCRRKRCVPFVVHISDWQERFKPVDELRQDNAG